MPANPWELRADVRPLDAAAQRWTELGALVARRGDELVDAARRATEGWDAAAAESYEQHRRQVLANLDRFTTLAAQIAGSLRAVSAVITSSQKELDHNWTKVAMVPHEVVGESRHLVFKPSEDDDRGKVTRGQAESEEIRRRLTLSLDQESARMRAARAELVMVRTELMTLTGSKFPTYAAPGQDESGVGTVAPPSTSVPGAAQGGVAGLAPMAPISVHMPHLQGISPSLSGLVPGVAAAAAAAAAGRRGARGSTTGTPPVGGMGAGAMAARAGTMSRGMASGRAGGRMAAPRLERTSAEEAAARAARDKETLKEAKRAALEEKRAERAARKAEREAERQNARDGGREKDRRARDEHADDDAVTAEEPGAGEDDGPESPAIVVVHEAAPAAREGEPRR